MIYISTIPLEVITVFLSLTIEWFFCPVRITYNEPVVVSITEAALNSKGWDRLNKPATSTKLCKLCWLIKNEVFKQIRQTISYPLILLIQLSILPHHPLYIHPVLLKNFLQGKTV
jgi:hypothetical protein